MQAKRAAIKQEACTVAISIQSSSEKQNARREANTDRKRKQRASNMTEKQHENFQNHVQRSLQGYRFGSYPVKDPAVKLLPIPENSRRGRNNEYYKFGTHRQIQEPDAKDIQHLFANDTSEYMKKYHRLLSQLTKLVEKEVR